MRNASDLVLQLRVGKFARVAPFVAEDQRGFVIAESQQVLREVQAYIRVPARTGHGVRIREYRLVLAARADTAELPYERPESFRKAHRKFVKRRVAPDVLVTGALRHEPHEAAHVGAFDAFRTGSPKREIFTH